MNLLQRLFGKKKVENQPKKEIETDKKPNFRHLPKYQSEHSMMDDYAERRKREKDLRNQHHTDFTDAFFMGMSNTGDDSSSQNSDNNIQSSSDHGFGVDFGGGGFSGGGSSASWEDNSSGSSGYDSGSSYDSSSSDSGSSSYD